MSRTVGLLQVTYVSTVDGGGPVTHLRDLLPRVAEHGVKVRLLCQSDRVASAFRSLGIETDVVPVQSKWDVRAMARLSPEVAAADVVHVHDRRALLYAAPLARLRRTRLVSTYHGLPEELAGLPGRPGERVPADISPTRRALLFGAMLPLEAMLARLGTTVVPSRALADYLVGHGFPARRVVVLPSGIDPRRDDPGPSHSPVRVGTAAILEPRKAVDVLLDACARVHSPIHVDIFGDGSLRAALESQARSLGLDTTFHGRVADLRDRLESLDLFVLPSRGENLPIAVLEAMAAALPVIATRVGGNAELVAHGESGLVVEPDDPTGMANAIDALAADPSRMRAYGRAGAIRVREQFDANDAGRRMAELYRSLCASST